MRMVCDCYKIDRVEDFISVIDLQNGGNGICVMRGVWLRYYNV